MTRSMAALTFGLVLVATTACVPLPTPPITTLQTAPASELEPLLSGEAMAVLAGDEQEDWTTGCLRDELARSLPGARMLSAQEVRDMLFPWLEPTSAPKDDAALAAIIARPAVAERLREERLRYVVVVRHTAGYETNGAEAVLVGASFGQQLDETSARIFDIRSARVLEGGSARAAAVIGHAHVVIYGVVAFSPTERAACHELRDALLKELASDAAPDVRHAPPNRTAPAGD